MTQLFMHWKIQWNIKKKCLSKYQGGNHSQTFSLKIENNYENRLNYKIILYFIALKIYYLQFNKNENFYKILK